MPALLFESIYSSDFESAVNLRLIAFAVAAVLLMIALSIAFVLLVEKNKNRHSVMIQGLYRSNFALVGIPVAEALMRGGDISVVAVLLAVIVPVYNVAAVLILEGFGGRKVNVRHMLLDVAKNPLIISSALGLLFLGLDIKLPGIVMTVVEDMADAAGPIALFLLGAFFRFETMGKYKREISIVSVGRLVVIPGIFLTLGYLFGFRGAEFAGLIALFASCTAVASFTMAEQMGGDSELAGDIVVTTSVLCSFTLYLWSVLFMSLGAF
jgi:predicted permease